MLTVKKVIAPKAKEKTRLEILLENKEMMMKQVDKTTNDKNWAKMMVWLYRLDAKIQDEFDKAS